MKLKYSAKAHGYWLDGKRCKSPSAIAKVPDDSSALDKWRRRQTAIGLALRPDLLTQLAAAGDDKKAVDAICELAMEVAGATTGRDRGTAVHRITEMLDDGDLMLETPDVIATRKQWVELLDRYDLEVIHSEGIVVHPEMFIAGRFDRIVRHKATGKLYILDIKTGADADKYLHAHCVQQRLYASAPLMATGPKGDVDFEVTEFEPMPPVDQAVALIAHLPADGAADIIAIDIAAGGECIDTVIKPIWNWRARRDLRVEFAAKRPNPHQHTESLGVAIATVDIAKPYEGPTVDVDALRERYKALDKAAESWIVRLRETALRTHANLDFHLSGNYTARRARIFDGLVALAAGGFDRDEAVTAIVRAAVGEDAMQWPTIGAAVAVGSLNATDAATFAELCHLLVKGSYGIEHRIDGPVAVPVAA